MVQATCTLSTGTYACICSSGLPLKHGETVAMQTTWAWPLWFTLLCISDKLPLPIICYLQYQGLIDSYRRRGHVHVYVTGTWQNSNPQAKNSKIHIISPYIVLMKGQTAAVTIISYKPLNFARYTIQHDSCMSSPPLWAISPR